jgi:alpha-D-xyloside xylohydrolase
MGFLISRRFAWNISSFRLGLILLGVVSLGAVGMAQNGPLVLARDGGVISLEAYAPNIVRVTMSTDRAAATAASGYGFLAKPSAPGWTHERDSEGNDIFRSARMVVRVSPGNLAKEKLPQPMPLDALNLQLRDPYFGGGGGHGSHNDALLVTTPEGKTLLHMRSWAMVPENAAVAAADARAKGHRIMAAFDSPQGEHYYGLGQQQKGWMDLRDHEIRCWHDYGALGGENVCVPFMISSRGYGMVWDNPSKTTIELGFNGRNLWSSEVGDRVSYFVIAGETSDEIY